VHSTFHLVQAGFPLHFVELQVLLQYGTSPPPPTVQQLFGAVFKFPQSHDSTTSEGKLLASEHVRFGAALDNFGLINPKIKNKKNK